MVMAADTGTGSLADVLRLARERVEAEDARRAAEAVAGQIVVGIVEAVVEDPSLDKLHAMVMGLLLEGRTVPEAVLALGLLPVPPARGPLADPGIVERLDAIHSAIKALSASPARGHSEPSTAAPHAAAASEPPAVPQFPRRGRAEVPPGPASSLFDLPPAGPAAVPTATSTGALGLPAGGALPDDVGDYDGGDHDADGAGDEEGPGRGGPHVGRTTHRLRVAASEYINAQGRAVGIQEVRARLDREGALPPDRRHALDDMFSKTFIRFGEDRWLTGDGDFPPDLAEREAVLPRLKGFRERALAAIARWNEGLPDGDRIVAGTERPRRRPIRRTVG